MMEQININTAIVWNVENMSSQRNTMGERESKESE